MLEKVVADRPLLYHIGGNTDPLAVELDGDGGG